MPKNQPQTEASTETAGPSLKDQALAEEVNAARMKHASDAQQEDPTAPPPKPQEEFVSLGEIASRGYDALHEAYRLQREADKNKPVYVPPPMTERQLSAREEELEAGRRAVARNEVQLANRPTPDRNALEIAAEGQTNPVYRPANLVPDPTIPATPGIGGGQGSAAGTRIYG